MELTDAQRQDIKENKDIAAFSYVWIVSVLVLFSRRDSPFIQFHARQAVILFILSVVFYLLPYLRYADVLVVAAMISGFINATQGRYYVMPVIADIVKRHITVSSSWEFVKKQLLYIVNLLKRLFKKSPKVVVESSVDAISKIRGIDVLKVNSLVKSLEKELLVLRAEKKTLQLQVKVLESEFLVKHYLFNLNYQAAP